MIGYASFLAGLSAMAIFKFIQGLIRRMISSEEPCLADELLRQELAPVIVFQNMKHSAAKDVDELGLHLVFPTRDNKLAKKDIKRLMLRRIIEVPRYPPVIRGSCNGFIIFGALERPWRYFICNPVTQELITLGNLPDFVCGFYFRRSRNEYRLLCCGRTAVGLFRYYACDLRLQSHKHKELGVFPHGPSTYDLGPAPAPVTVDGFLYYMMDHRKDCRNPSIMMLDLETEELKFMHDPGRSRRLSFLPEQTYLLEVEGRLCYFYKQDRTLQIWSLEDRATWSWTKGHRIELESNYGWGLNWGEPLFPEKETIQPLVMKGGGLILNWGSRGLVRYDMQTGRFKEIMKVGHDPSLSRAKRHFYEIPVATCAMSLMPLSKLNI